MLAGEEQNKSGEEAGLRTVRVQQRREKSWRGEGVQLSVGQVPSHRAADMQGGKKTIRLYKMKLLRPTDKLKSASLRKG